MRSTKTKEFFRISLCAFVGVCFLLTVIIVPIVVHNARPNQNEVITSDEIFF